MCNCGGIYFTVIPLTLLPITATPGGAAAAIISMEYIRVYLAIAIFIYIDIVYKRVTNIVKDNIVGKPVGHASQWATSKPYQKLENSHLNILTTT